MTRIFLSAFLAAFAFTANAAEVPQAALDALNLSVQDLNANVKVLAQVPTRAPTDSIPLPSACANPKTITVEQSKGQVPSVVLAAQLVDCSIVLLDGDWADCLVNTKNDVTLKTKPGATRARLRDKSCEGKALIVNRGKNLRLDGIELTGAKGGNGNEAGIRQEGAGLTVFDTYIHDNYNGILNSNLSTARPVPDDVIVIERSRFERNGGAGGQSHNIYASPATKSLSILNSEFVDPKEGHNVKARIKSADGVTIRGSVLAMLSGNGSRSIDMSIGGRLVIDDSVIQQIGQQQWHGGIQQNGDVIGMRRELEYVGGVPVPWTKPSGDSVTITNSLAIFGNAVAQFIWGSDPTITFDKLRVVSADPSLRGAYRFTMGRDPDGTNVYPYPYSGAVTFYRDLAEAGLPAYDGTLASIPRPSVPAGLLTPPRDTVADAPRGTVVDPVPPRSPPPAVPPTSFDPSNLKPGWNEVPNTTLSTVFPKNNHPVFASRRYGWGVEGPHTIITAWNGAAFENRPDIKRYRFHLNHLGGHGGYAGNEDYWVDLFEGVKRWNEPTELTIVPVTRADGWVGNSYRPPAGRAPSMHGLGRAFIDGIGVLSYDNSPYPYGTDAPENALAAWITDVYGTGETVPFDHPRFRAGDGWAHAYFDKERNVAIIHMANSHIFDPVTRKATLLPNPPGGNGVLWDGATAYDSMTKKVVMTSGAGGGSLLVVDSADYQKMKTSYYPKAKLPSTLPPNIKQSGVTWIGRPGKFMLWHGGRETWVLDVNGPSPVFTEYANTEGVALPKSGGAGIYGRWAYIAEYDACWGFNWSNGNTVMIKVPAGIN